MKKVWTTQELAYLANGRIKLPDNLIEYDILAYPHWALFVSTHLNRLVSIEDIEGNLPYLEMLPHDKALDVKLSDLKEIGYKVGETVSH